MQIKRTQTKKGWRVVLTSTTRGKNYLGDGRTLQEAMRKAFILADQDGEICRK